MFDDDNYTSNAVTWVRIRIRFVFQLLRLVGRMRMRDEASASA